MRHAAIVIFAISILAVSMVLAVTNAASTTAYNSSQLNFGTPINLSNDNYNASYPWVANVGSHVYVAWTEEDHGIYFRMSPDNGTTWNPPIDQPGLKISSTAGTAGYPIVAANQSDVYVAWSQAVDTSGVEVLQIFVAASTDYGASFTQAQQLTSGYSSNGFITPVIATSGQYVYVAYSANGKQSYVLSNTNYGAPGNWTQAVRFGATHEPQVTAWGANGYAVADGPEYAVTHNGGVTWTEVLNYTGSGDEPFIATSGSNVYIVSQSKTVNGTIHFIRCTNYGMTCSPKRPPGVQISNNLTNSWQPQLVASGNYVYVVYHSVTAPISNWLTVSSNDGVNFSTPIEISSSVPITGWATQIVTSNCGSGYSCAGGNGSNYVYTQWPEYNNVWNTWFMYGSMSSNYGANWTAAPGVEISNDPSFSSVGPNDIATSSIAAFANHAFITWTMCQQCGQNHNITLSDSQVMFAVTDPSSAPTTSSTTSSTPTTSSTLTTRSVSRTTSSSATTSSSRHVSTVVSTIVTTKTSSVTSVGTTSSAFKSTSSSSISSSTVSLAPPTTTTTSAKPQGSDPLEIYAAVVVVIAIAAASSIIYMIGFRKPVVKYKA
jgi:hypothetical protein